MAQVRVIGTAGPSAADSPRRGLSRRAVAAGGGILLVAAGLVGGGSAAVAGPVAPGAAAVVAPAAAAPEIPTSVGRDFWLAGPPAGAIAGGVIPAWDLYISAVKAGSVTVAVPGLAGGPWTRTVAVSAGAVTKVSLPSGSTIPQPTAGSDPTLTDLGVHVTSTVDVSVYGQSPEERYRTGFLALPSSTLGTRYRVLSYMSPDELGSYIAVVGTANGTSVTLTLTDGTTEVVSLNQGDTFAYVPPTFELDVPWGVITDESDATGILVTSTKPVGVFGGAYLAAVPYNKGNMNALAQMMPPTSTWGTDFLAVRLGTRIKGDRYKVLADKDGTEVRVNGALATTLDEGDAYEFLYPESASVAGDENLQITTSKPALVGQFGTGLGSEFVDPIFDAPSDYYADPLFSLVPPQEQYLDSYIVAMPDMDNNKGPGAVFPTPGIYWINVVVPTDAIGSVRLNGSAVAAGEFTAIRDSGFSGAQLSLPTFGTYRVTAGVPFGMSVYGWGQDDGMGFPGGMALMPIASIASVVLDDPTVSGSGKAGSYPEASVTVEDADGDAVAGVPVTFEVTDAGANDQIVTDVTDAQGVASATFPGTAPESGTLTVDAGAVEVDGTITWSSTVPQVPSAPKLTLAPKDGGIQATWKPSASSGSSAITQYKIVAVPGGEFCTVTPKAGQRDFNCTVTGLTNGKPYRLESYARNDAGWSTKSTFGPGTPATRPGKPSNLKIDSRSKDGTMQISWKPPASDGGLPITGYVVFWRLEAGTKLVTMPKVSVLERTITGLKPGARYRVSVAAVTKAGRGTTIFLANVKMPK